MFLIMDTLTYLRIIISIAIVVFLIGIYKNLIRKIVHILQTQESNQENKTNATSQLFQVILKEAILQYRIKDRSQILWIRHLIIFGGFVTFFVIELLIGITKNYHSFNFIGPIFKVGLDFSGGVLLLGLIFALVHWIIFRKEEKRLIDIKSLVLLFIVVISGLLSSSSRILLSPESPFTAHSLVGYAITELSGFFSCPLEEIHYWLFVFHVTIAAGFIAYIPFSKLIHMLAAPIGRVVTMDKGYVDRKRAKVSESLLE